MKHRLPKPKVPKVKPRTISPRRGSPNADVRCRNGGDQLALHPFRHEKSNIIDREVQENSKTERPKRAHRPCWSSPPRRDGPIAPYLIQTHGLEAVRRPTGRQRCRYPCLVPGEVVGLLGKNGAGQDNDVLHDRRPRDPNQGNVFMGEEDVTQMPMYRRARRGIGYLPQEESIFAN